MTEYIKWFKELHKEDVPIAGGKGANLGELWNAGFPVPNGFVVVADAYKYFLKESKLDEQIYPRLQELDVEDSAKLQKAAAEVQKLIRQAHMPEDIKEEIEAAYSCLDGGLNFRKKSAEELVREKHKSVFVAVRSSATAEDLPEASFAGQQATFLNQKGKEQVVRAVQNCWASLFNARAIYYRKKNNFPEEKVAIAVVVQKQINSEKSGIIFTVDPSTNNEKHLVIEAIYGLGEAVVSGAVNPNTYIIDKTSGKVLETDTPIQEFLLARDKTGDTIKRNLTTRQVYPNLNDKELQVLTKLALKSENHYKKPQDMEWAEEENKIYLVQSRPITTLQKETTEEKEKISEEEKEISAEPILKGLAASPGIASGPVSIIHSEKEMDRIKQGDVLVTEMTNPDYVQGMKRASAIVTDEGGITCHAAIVAREMGTPCVVGTEKATKVLRDGQVITVDGSSGSVYEGELKLEKPEQPIVKHQELATKTKIKAICDLPDFAQRAASTGADGVGLLRLEGIIASGKTHPAKYLRENRLNEYSDLIFRGVHKIAYAFKGKPVWVRTSDIRTDEYRGLEGSEEEPKEANPMLGWHAIRRSLDQPELFKAEIRALKKIKEKGLDVGVMIPFVISVDEIRKAKELIRECGLEPQKDIEFGVMIETPAACWIIEELCAEGIDFVSFGTNDLTQLTLGVDRDNERIAHLYSEMHSAVLQEISRVVQACKKYNVKTSICGQAGSRPEMAEFLVEAGIDSISVNVDAFDVVRQMVFDTEKKLGIT